MNFLDKKSERKKARSANAIFLEKIIVFLCYTFAILLIPIGIFDYGRKKRKYNEKNRRMAKSSFPTSRKHSIETRSASKNNADMKHTSEKYAASSPDITKESTKIPSPVADLHTDKSKTHKESKIASIESSEVTADSVEKTRKAEIAKSTPRYEKDKYIRKIMHFSFCEVDVVTLAELHTGITFDINIARIDSTDKIIFFHLGKRLGIAEEEDESVLSTCISLGDKLYGVITDIDLASGIVEYEAWIDKAKQF